MSAVGFVDDIAVFIKGKSSEENCNRLLHAHENICKPWAARHGSKFAPDKYQLSHLTRKRTANLEHPLVLPERTIFPARTITYLGVVLDTKLLWHKQILINKTKALKSIGGIAGLAESVFGARFPRMRQMLLSVFIPQLTYACSVWYTPPGETKHNKSQLKQLVSIQLQANRVIAGAYKATSAPALNIETHTLPIELKLDQLTSISALRIATSPLYSVIIATRTPSRTLLSPLEILINRYEKLSASSITELEKIAPLCTAPWWIPPPTVIHKDKTAAKSAHDNLLNSKSQSENLVIYTDGSGINGKIGAAAVGPNATWNSFLGPAESFTLYSAELYGIVSR